MATSLGARNSNGNNGNGNSRRLNRKRPLTPIDDGISDTYNDRNNDYICPICFGVIEEAYMTKCGHSFWYCHYECIRRSLDENSKCPKCNFQITDKVDPIFPNITLNELIIKHKRRLDVANKCEASGNRLDVADILSSKSNDDMVLSDINYLLESLSEKKQQLELNSKSNRLQLLKEFLLQSRKNKEEQLNDLKTKLDLLSNDLKVVEENLVQFPTASTSPAFNGNVGVAATSNNLNSTVNAGASTSVNIEFREETDLPLQRQDGFNGSKYVNPKYLVSHSISERRKRLSIHYEDLEDCYFSIKQSGAGSKDDSLELFMEHLSKFTKFDRFRALATLNYGDLYNHSSIVSSIEFDRDCDYFAIAGVTKKIKIFEYSSIIRDAVDIHYPVTEMTCSSKISCISWSAYHKEVLASSDYEGTVALWDAFNGVKTRCYQEHEKRCWCVDFNKVDPKLFASGSDDAKVKLWSTNLEHSIASLEAKANVCCVKFSPVSRYHLAFGSADHCVHYYDLRNTSKSLADFKGHRKAVSYTNFVNENEIVSASTDSQLKLWDLNVPYCTRTFRGHSNEKNFVGLATDGDYIACGSENNSLYLYYKGLSKQLLSFKFDVVRSIFDKDSRDDDSNEFVSAVCWKRGANVLVAANSQGTIKVLELV
ncbi:E3 ubiquitin-protein ligase RFWD2 [Trichoplax sp. H2]|nr:E3 ubiquitin-protein ligase RFWD2 [Trichoplax sp. H2]|eukprot:RDD43416.1 E3 ubiquitin-protein ligase RFWD2 [Trichoplax sp. H2]